MCFLLSAGWRHHQPLMGVGHQAKVQYLLSATAHLAVNGGLCTQRWTSYNCPTKRPGHCLGMSLMVVRRVRGQVKGIQMYMVQRSHLEEGRQLYSPCKYVQLPLSRNLCPVSAPQLPKPLREPHWLLKASCTRVIEGEESPLYVISVLMTPSLAL